MKALEWSNLYELKMRDIGMPVPGEGWVLLKVGFAGICGSELSAYKGENELRKPPSVMGHEFSGTVVASGSQKDDGLVGKKVTVNPFVTCGKCSYCVSGERQLCAERKIIGVHFPGAFAEYVSVPAYSCYETSDLLIGSIAEPFATAVRAVRMSGSGKEDDVLVIGAGSIGIFATAVLKKFGVSTVLVADTNHNRLNLAREWGADEVFDPTEYDISSFKVDSAIDAAGLESTRNLAVRSVKPGKITVFVGLHSPTSNIPASLIVRNEVQIHGSFAYSDKDFSDAVGLLDEIVTPKRLHSFDVRNLDRGDSSFRELIETNPNFSKIILKA